jgi:tungstate transport system ATP-binding protein
MNDVAAPAALPVILGDAEVHANDIRVLGPISLTIARGGPTVLIGPNGSGKSTLLRLAMGLIGATRGSVSWGGQPRPPESGQAIVFQRPVMLRRTCAANVRYALRAAGQPAAEVYPLAQELLRRVGLEQAADRPARRLSGGETQRLALARALARRPSVLFLDEPSASLDPGATAAIEDLIRTIAASGVKIVMATHDLGEARRLAADVALLHRGRVIESGPAERFFAAPATEVTRRFLAGELLI